MNLFRLFRRSEWEPEVRHEAGLDIDLADSVVRRAFSELKRGGSVLKLKPVEYQAMIATGRLKETDVHYKGLQIVKLEG